MNAHLVKLSLVGGTRFRRVVRYEEDAFPLLAQVLERLFRFPDDLVSFPDYSIAAVGSREVDELQTMMT